jgi:hypothetical protein
MIECSLMGLKKHGSLLETDNKKIKYGQYLSSHFYSIPEFGKKCWVVAVNIIVDYEKYISEGLSPEQVTKECIEYLNTPPKSKYGKRRKESRCMVSFEKSHTDFTLKIKIMALNTYRPS